MTSRGIRGAITVNANTKEEIRLATIELLNEMLLKNEIKTKDISFAIFTLTSDLNADFPAKYARLDGGFNFVPMMCYQELDVPNSLKMCLKILLKIHLQALYLDLLHIDSQKCIYISLHQKDPLYRRRLYTVS
jgi:chorismate mutase